MTKRFTNKQNTWAGAAMVLLLLAVPAAAQDDLSAAEEWTPAPASPAALDNPAVRAILERPRTTPGDYLQATLTLLDLGEPDLAANAFHELTELDLNDEAKAALVADFGAAALLRLPRATKLGPNVDDFVNSAMAASAAQTASQEHISQLIGQLDTDNTQQQASAVATLAGIGQPAVVPLLQQLTKADAASAQSRGIRAALVRLGPLAEGPLLAALSAGDARPTGEAASILASIGTPRAAPLMAQAAVQSSAGSAVDQAYTALTGQHPSLESATGLLERTLANLESGAMPLETNADGRVTYWRWSAKPVDDPQPRPIDVTVDEANLLLRAELARQLAALRPGIPSIESKALRLAIESQAILGEAVAGTDLGQLSSDRLDRVLTDALDENQAAAAIAALGVVAERRDPGVLVTTNGQPSPTARSLEHPHPSVVAAALQAIAAIDSPTPFPGASKVCPAIVRLATARGRRQVLVGAPQLDVAVTWAGSLASRGFSGQTAATGADIIELGRQSGDIELVLVDMNIDHPAVRDVVFQLRRQPTTALLPIGLLARETQLARAERIAYEHQGVVALPRPHSDEGYGNLANQLLAMQPRGWPTADERAAQGGRAIEIMNQLMAADRDFYRLRAASGMIATAMRADQHGEAAWQLLAQLGTRESQVALLAYVAAPSLDIEARQAAAQAFNKSVERFGVRLTSDEIIRQYNLYNASEHDSSEVQQLFGSVLDTLEAGRKTQDTPAP